MLCGSHKRKDKARSLITKIVNALTAKLKIGGPMASLYLLGNPDHYTNQKFVVFYWKSLCRRSPKWWKQDSDVQPDKVILQKTEMVNILDYQLWMTTSTGHMSSMISLCMNGFRSLTD